MAKYAVAIAIVGVLLVSSVAAQSTSATTYCAGITSEAIHPTAKTRTIFHLQDSDTFAAQIKNGPLDMQVLRGTARHVLWDAVGQE